MQYMKNPINHYINPTESQKKKHDIPFIPLCPINHEKSHSQFLYLNNCSAENHMFRPQLQPSESLQMGIRMAWDGTNPTVMAIY